MSEVSLYRRHIYPRTDHMEESGAHIKENRALVNKAHTRHAHACQDIGKTSECVRMCAASRPDVLNALLHVSQTCSPPPECVNTKHHSVDGLNNTMYSNSHPPHNLAVSTTSLPITKLTLVSVTLAASPPNVSACAQPDCLPARTPCHTTRRRTASPPNASACV